MNQTSLLMQAGNLYSSPISDFWQVSTEVQDPEIPNLPIGADTVSYPIVRLFWLQVEAEESTGVTGTATTSQAQTIAASGTAAPAAVTATATTSQAQTIAASGTAAPATVDGTATTSQAQTIAASGTFATGGVTGDATTSQAQTIDAAGTHTVAAVTGTGVTSQAQTIDAAGTHAPAAVTGDAATSQAQTIDAAGTFLEAGNVVGTATTSQAQTSDAAGAVVNPDVAIDTHDGFWANEYRKMFERKPKVSEVVEIVRENPKETMAVVREMPEVKAIVYAKYPDISYSEVINNAKLQLFIAKQLLNAIESRRISDEEDDLAMLLLTL